jgi:hypothetical protein
MMERDRTAAIDIYATMRERIREEMATPGGET